MIAQRAQEQTSADSAAGTVTVVLFASVPCADLRDWARRFERYEVSGGHHVRVVTVGSSGGPWLDALPETDDLAVLWDAAYGMPPKEMEALARGWQPGMWHAGVRFAGSPPARGVSAWLRWWGRRTGSLRRWLGRVSDPHPPCVAASGRNLKKRSDLMVRTSPREWTSVLLQSASRDREPIREVPVMWAQVNQEAVK